MSMVQVERIQQTIAKARDAANLLRNERYLTKWGKRHLDEALTLMGVAETLLRRMADDAAQEELEEFHEEKPDEMPAWW